MNESPQASLKADTLEVEDLVESVRAGRIRIPAFQRGLRWTHGDVERLFESIHLGYPIGNLLMWERSADAGEFKLGAMSIRAPENQSAWFVVDGQQRLTSLANALSREGLDDPRFQLSFDLVREKFVRYRPGSAATDVPLPTLFDLNALILWFARNPELAERPDLLEVATRVAKSIRQFKIPVYIVRNSNEDVLRDIFDRMNNFGKKLTRAEVFSALSIAQHGERSQADHGSYAEVAEQLHALTGFGVVDDKTVFACFLARRGPDTTREIRSEFEPQGKREVIDTRFMGETVEAALDGCTRAMLAAVEFLQAEAGIPHFAFLPYRYILIVLTRFFAHHPTPSNATVRDLRRWVWLAAVGGPWQFKGSATGATRALAKKISPSERGSIESLLELTGTAMIQQFDLGDFNTSNADTRISLCAIWRYGPMRLDFYEGDPERISRSAISAALGEATSANSIFPHVVPRSALAEENRTSPGARVLDPLLDDSLGGTVVTEFRRAAETAVAGGEVAMKVLQSHLIDQEMAVALVDGNYDLFATLRLKAVRRITQEFLGSMAEWDSRVIPPLHSLLVDEEDVASNGASGSFDSNRG